MDRTAIQNYFLTRFGEGTHGLFVYDVRRGRIAPLDNDAKTYNRLAWSEDGVALAVLKGDNVDNKRERENVLLAYANVAASLGLYGGGSKTA